MEETEKARPVEREDSFEGIDDSALQAVRRAVEEASAELRAEGTTHPGRNGE